MEGIKDLIEILEFREEFNKATIISWRLNGEGYEDIQPGDVELITLTRRS
jgi:hypothetical protein